MILKKREKYLQIALNNNLKEAERIIPYLPVSEHILIEAGTPLIKTFGAKSIKIIRRIAQQRLSPPSKLKEQSITVIGQLIRLALPGIFAKQTIGEENDFIWNETNSHSAKPYIVADLKCADLAEKEVGIAAKNGASAATCLGVAPIETIDSFIAECKNYGLDSMVDMMNVDNAMAILKQLKEPPDVVALHRGADETEYNKEKQIPYYQIKQIKGNYNTLVAIAGGDTLREVEQAFFNDADIVVVWKSFYQSAQNTAQLAQNFYKKLNQ